MNQASRTSETAEWPRVSHVLMVSGHLGTCSQQLVSGSIAPNPVEEWILVGALDVFLPISPLKNSVHPPTVSQLMLFPAHPIFCQCERRPHKGRR